MKIRILCLEGEWDENHQDITVEPLLKLLMSLDAWTNKKPDLKISHHLCQSRTRLERQIERIDLRFFARGAAMNCLYFAFHGNKCGLYADDEPITFKQIADSLGDKANGKIVFFSSCGQRGSAKKLQEFKDQTKAQIVIGYETEVDWLAATLFELWFFGELMARSNSINGHFSNSLRQKANQPIFQKLKPVIL